MAAGDVKLMSSFVTAMANMTPADKWGSDQIKVALITSSTTPSQTDSDARWGAGGGQNYSTNEVTPGGNYSAGGVVLSGTAVVNSTTHTNLNATSPVTWAANASNPTNARYAILYDNTTANKEVLGYIDLGGNTSLVPGLQLNLAGVSSGTATLYQSTVN
jgi:hypothetical protein